MKNSHDQKIESVVSSMVAVYEMLKATSIRDHTGQNLEFLHGNRTMDDDQRRARESMDRAIDIITSVNPHISKLLVYEKLLFGIVQQAVYYTGDEHDVKSEVKQATQDLLNYHPTREIDIPIANLEVGPEPIKFGLITFYRMTEEDKKDVWLSRVTDKKLLDDMGVRSYARVVALGDLTINKEDADQVVNDSLTYLRAVGFPVNTTPQIQFGVINDFPISHIRPYRSAPTTQKTSLEADIRFSWQLGTGYAPYDLRKDILNKVESSTLEELQNLIETDYRKPRTSMRRKALLGLRWLGEATKPDVPEAKFAKLAFALEALIGGEAKEEFLSTRGLTATLAERGAFIAGENGSQRREIHEAIYEYYRYRSGIVHGGEKQISDKQLEGFASLTQRVTWSLLYKIDYFADIDGLQRWVLGQRYS